MRSREPISDTNVIQDIGNGVAVGLIGSLGVVAGCRALNRLDTPGSSTPQLKRCAWKGTLGGGGKVLEDRRLCDKGRINTLTTLPSLTSCFRRLCFHYLDLALLSASSQMPGCRNQPYTTCLGGCVAFYRRSCGKDAGSLTLSWLPSRKIQYSDVSSDL